MATPSSPNLLEATVQRMKASHFTTLEIHRRTGLPYYWLRKVRTGEIKDPSVNRVQALYEFLTDKPIVL